MDRWRRRLVVAPLIGLVLTLLALTGCVLWQPAPPADPLAEYRPALRPEFTAAPGQVEAWPRYSITVKIDPASRAFTGTLDLTLPAAGAASLDDLYFRLYPNLRQFGGSLTASNVRVDGKTVNYSFEAEGTGLHVALLAPLRPGGQAHVRLNFAGKTPQRAAGHYTVFGMSEDVLNLTNFYPILASRRDGKWALEIASPQGDVGFHGIALYRVEVAAPADQVIAATGVQVLRSVSGDWATTRFVQGPAREFTLVLSPRFQTAEMEAYAATVRSYFLPEDAEAGRAALNHAAAALRIFSDQFGPYPYREMAVVEAPISFYGMEFPGLNLIGREVYNKHIRDLEDRVVHEAAHQWWYNQVGSDQTQTPWLDEGLAEWSMYVYYQARYGTPAADRLRRSRWEAPVQAARQRGDDAPIGRPVTAYKNNYEVIIYGKSALFFTALRAELGEETFCRVLRAYVERFHWQIATPADFQGVVKEVGGRDLSELFALWVGREP